MIAPVSIPGLIPYLLFPMGLSPVRNCPEPRSLQDARTGGVTRAGLRATGSPVLLALVETIGMSTASQIAAATGLDVMRTAIPS